MNLSKLIISFIDFLVFYNIYLALAIAFAGSSIAFLFSGKFSLNLFLIIFLMTFSLYSLNRLTDKEEDLINSPKRIWFAKHSTALLIISILSYLLAGVMAITQNLFVLALVILVLVLGVIYSVKIPIFKKLIKVNRLKDLLLIKNFTIAIDWVIAMVFIPMAYFDFNLNLGVIILGLFIFFRAILNTIIFDIKDMTGDKKQGIITIPLKIGLKNTLLLGYLINTLLGLMIIYAVANGFLPYYANLINLSTLFAYFYLFGLDKNLFSEKILYGVLVDGEYFVIALLIIIAKLI